MQLQYTGGPLTIVRWAPIVNAHLFPGPAIITALSEAAQKAIAAYNTSVQTDISASPAPSVDGDDDSVGAGETEEPDSDSASEEEEFDDEDRKGRKQSVVSVSTTISTKTETISPQPSLRPTISRGSTEADVDEDEEAEDPQAALEALGPPPFYRSLLLLAEMSSQDHFFTPQYVEACLKHARLNKDFVMGFIAQRSLNSEKDDNFIVMTPGVQLAAGRDAHGQQYNTPRKVIGEAGADVMIVGRGIYAASDRRRAAHEYRKQGWLAYEERMKAGRRRR